MDKGKKKTNKQTKPHFKKAGFHQGKIKYEILQESRLSIVYMFPILMTQKTRQM